LSYIKQQFIIYTAPPIGSQTRFSAEDVFNSGEVFQRFRVVLGKAAGGDDNCVGMFPSEPGYELAGFGCGAGCDRAGVDEKQTWSNSGIIRRAANNALFVQYLGDLGGFGLVQLAADGVEFSGEHTN
jgi:hypothetical protein